MPFALPDWVPWWVPLMLIIPGLLYGLAFVFMPFSVLGVKTRLEVIEARLDDIQHELRLIMMRLPLGSQEMDFEDIYAPAAQAQKPEPQVADRPPIPPAPRDRFGDDDAPVERQPPPPHMRPLRREEPVVVRPQRAEPRLDRGR
jgi:hypothetical protein